MTLDQARLVDYLIQPDISDFNMASFCNITELLRTSKEAIKIYRVGLDVSKKNSDLKTEGELSEALMLLGADDEISW